MRSRWKLIIFDCDGVLVDSEPIANRIFREMLEEIGLFIGYEDSIREFSGRSFKSCLEIIKKKLNRNVPFEFGDHFRERTITAFKEELQLIPGIIHALDSIQVPVCVASSSDHIDLKVKLELTGLLSRFSGCIFSTADVKEDKPAPAIFLYAASKMMTNPTNCVVIEDSPIGVEAGVAAKMTVLGYSRKSSREELLMSGANIVFSDMNHLPEILQDLSTDLCEKVES